MQVFEGLIVLSFSSCGGGGLYLKKTLILFVLFSEGTLGETWNIKGLVAINLFLSDFVKFTYPCLSLYTSQYITKIRHYLTIAHIVQTYAD